MLAHSSRVKDSALVVGQRRTADRATREISARRSPVVTHFRRLSKLRFPPFSEWNLRRRDFASSGKLIQLDRSRSTVCIIRFRFFVIGRAFRLTASVFCVCTEVKTLFSDQRQFSTRQIVSSFKRRSFNQSRIRFAYTGDLFCT